MAATVSKDGGIPYIPIMVAYPLHNTGALDLNTSLLPPEWEAASLGWLGLTDFVYLASVGPRNVWPCEEEDAALLGAAWRTTFKAFGPPMKALHCSLADRAIQYGLVRPHADIIFNQITIPNTSEFSYLALNKRLRSLATLLAYACRSSADSAESFDRQWADLSRKEI